jgi:hypothetical protein
MKNFKILFLFFALVIFFSACEKITPPYKESKGGGNDTTGVLKNVLLEDYTGHTCVNCPTAAVIAHDLKNLYGDRLIVMAVHAGYFADPHPGIFENDYRTQAGNEWNTFFGFQNYPSGLIDRVPNAPGDYSALIQVNTNDCEYHLLREIFSITNRNKRDNRHSVFRLL